MNAENRLFREALTRLLNKKADVRVVVESFRANCQEPCPPDCSARSEPRTRNTIPRDVPFFQKFRTLMPEIRHKRGAYAIGGMTALFANRSDTGLNERALKSLKEYKKNEAIA